MWMVQSVQTYKWRHLLLYTSRRCSKSCLVPGMTAIKQVMTRSSFASSFFMLLFCCSQTSFYFILVMTLKKRSKTKPWTQNQQLVKTGSSCPVPQGMVDHTVPVVSSAQEQQQHQSWQSFQHFQQWEQQRGSAAAPPPQYTNAPPWQQQQQQPVPAAMGPPATPWQQHQHQQVTTMAPPPSYVAP